MSTIGTLEIQMLADLGRLKSDMDKAKGLVGDASTQMRSALGGVQRAFGALGVGLSVAGFVGFVKSAIDAKANLFDLSLQTGINVEALGSLAQVAKYSQTELNDVASASNKLSKFLATNTEDSKGAAQGLKALGINFADFKRQAADEQLLTVARAMNDFEDGTGKAAVAMLLFGKTGATLLPFLKELADRGLVATTQTRESAAAAKEYQDNLIALTGAGEGFATTLANDILPWLVKVTNELNEGRKAYGGWWRAMMDLGTLSPFKSTAEHLRDTREELERVNAELAKAQAKKPDGGLFAGGTQGGIAAQIKDLQDQQKVLTARNEYLKSQQAREALAGNEDVYDRFLRKRTLDVKAPTTPGRDPAVHRARQLLLDAHVQEWNAVLAAEAKWLAESGKETDRAVEQQAQRLGQYEDEVAMLERVVEEYGLTQEQIEALTVARLRDAQAALLQKRGVEDFNPAQAEMNRLYEQQAKALGDIANLREAIAAKQERDRTDPMAGAALGVKDYLREIESAGEATYRVMSNATRDMEDMLVSFVRTGKMDIRSLVDQIIAEFLRIAVIRPMMNSLLSGLGSIVPGLFGGGGFGTGSGFGNRDYAEFLAVGGPAQAGRPYVVGERGPELFVPRTAGTVVPNGAFGGGVTLAPVTNIQIDSRADREQVAQLTVAAVQAGNRQVLEALRARGVLAA